LKGPGHPEFRNLDEAESVEVSAQEEDSAFRNRKQPVDAVKQGCFACSVGSNEADDFSLLDAKAHPMKA